MYAIKGRSHPEQIALAQKFGIQNYPQPAGGCCLLTGPENFSEQLKDYLNNEFITDKTLLSGGKGHPAVGQEGTFRLTKTGAKDDG